MNVDPHYHCDDSYIIGLYKVSEAIVLKHIDVSSLEDLLDDEGNLPAPINHAILLLISNFYIQRESISEINISKVPYSLDYILSLYQNYYPSAYKSER